MKYIVELKYTNPSHEHVSLRRRVESTNRLVEARSEEEAVFRASNQQKALGFFVTEAKATAVQEAAKKVDFMKFGKDFLAQKLEEQVEEAVSFGRSGGVMNYDPKTEKSEKPAKGVSALDKDGNLVGHYPDLETAKKLKPGHTYQTSKGVAKEEVELDEAQKKLKPSYWRAEWRMGTKSDVDKNNKKIYDKLVKTDPEKAAKFHDSLMKMRKEEVEQTDEALLPKQQAVADKLKASELAANKEKAGYKFGKSLRMAKVAAKMQKEETEVQYIEEKLTAADPASEWIKDFVASDNPKFEGKSKKERIQMALGAYYAAKRSKNEEAGEKYNEKEVKNAEKKQDKKKGSLHKIEMEPEMEVTSQGVK